VNRPFFKVRYVSLPTRSMAIRQELLAEFSFIASVKAEKSSGPTRWHLLSLRTAMRRM